MSKSKLGLTLGKRIRILRLDLNLTQEELSELAGLSPKYLGEVERGRADPNLSSIEQIADALRDDPNHSYDRSRTDQYFGFEVYKSRTARYIPY